MPGRKCLEFINSKPGPGLRVNSWPQGGQEFTLREKPGERLTELETVSSDPGSEKFLGARRTGIYSAGKARGEQLTVLE